MAGTSIYKISEQVKLILGDIDIQAITSFVIDAYSSSVKREFYENKNDGVSEIDGTFLFSFGKETSLTPILELSTDMYFIMIPSSYLRLPHEMGINMVSFAKGQTKEFIRVNSGSVSMWSNLKANLLGGSQTYFVEGARMYFPKMTNTTNGNLLLKLAIALDDVDVDEELSIPRSVVDNIVSMVVMKFRPPAASKTAQ